MTPARAAEQAARASYGKLLAILSARTRDIAAAEDALADAFAKALTTWPETGVPDNPDAWLLTTAKNRLTDHQRRAARLAPQDAAPEDSTMPDAPDIPDHRLALMFTCAHPAIDPRLHTPLMLQCVLGIEAVDIARAFLVTPPAMAQRLVRAKSKIKAARIPFTTPDAPDLPPRLTAVLEAIHGAHALDWLGTGALSEEALFLASLLTTLLPDDPEAKGLAALLAFSLARAPARLDGDTFVPLPEQDIALWDHTLIDRAAHWLTQAQTAGRLGRFQLEAAIQAVHADRARTGHTDWDALVALHTGLARLYPTAGSHVARAAALGEAQGPAAGLAALDTLPPDLANRLQPYWATRGHLLAKSGALPDARSAYDKAISLTTEPPLIKYLTARRTALTASLH